VHFVCRSEDSPAQVEKLERCLLEAWADMLLGVAKCQIVALRVQSLRAPIEHFAVTKTNVKEVFAPEGGLCPPRRPEDVGSPRRCGGLGPPRRPEAHHTSTMVGRSNLSPKKGRSVFTVNQSLEMSRCERDKRVRIESGKETLFAQRFTGAVAVVARWLPFSRCVLDRSINQSISPLLKHVL
jgi:hypothetical protein